MEKSLKRLNTDIALKDWAARIKDCRSSGLQVKEWCQQNGFRPQTLYYWQKKLFNMVSAEQDSRFAEIPSLRLARHWYI